MILRAAIVLLLMLNLGAAAWWWLGGDAPASATAPAVDATSGALRLRLVSEAAPSPEVQVPVPMAATTNAPLVTTGETPAAPASPASTQCLRFGPFADAAARDAARPALSALATAVTARETPGRSSRGWWVFLPALPSRDEARAVGERIKAAGITDWYVMGEGDQANSVALGRYGNEDAARRREAEIRAKGFPAQAAPLGDRPTQWWLDARVAAGASTAALAAFGPSSEIPCAGVR